MVSRLALTAALAVGLCLNGGYLRGVVRTTMPRTSLPYQFFVRTIEAGLADAVQSDDLILCNENVWDSNAEAESAFFSRFTGRALHAQVLLDREPRHRRRRLRLPDLPQLRRVRSGVVRQTAKRRQ